MDAYSRLGAYYCFRCFRSCQLALVNLTDTLLANIDQGLLSGLLLIDLKKAFNLVDHTTLQT